MSQTLNTILERFSSKLSYRELDRTALDISRNAAAGNLGEREYSEWALISNDPLVVINYVKTFITMLASKLASAPFRPANDQLNEIVIGMRLNSYLTELYKLALSDGYAFLGLGLSNGKPIANIIDARYIMFNGNDPTLKDATEAVVFEVLPRTSSDTFISSFPSGYIDYAPDSEKIRTSYYHIEDGIVKLDVYNEGEDEPAVFEIPNIDRLPIVRFYGERFELSDKRYHYRGLYFQLASVIKAMALAATKIQIRTATSDDDNYIVAADAIANQETTWRNSGVKIMDSMDANGNPIANPLQNVPHDNQFLIQSLEMWKGIISDQLGPVVQSSSEAITREEVLARNEVRDAIANTYLSNVADAVAEVYRIIQMMLTGESESVVVQGGFLEATQRSKMLNNITSIYNLAKDSGLNAQGFIFEIVANSDLPVPMKQRVGQLLMQDPYASPVTKQLQQQVQQLNQTIAKQQTTITQLRVQASQRLERQAEWVASQERIKRGELQFKQWQQENKDTQEARMEVLRTLLQAGDTAGALAILNAVQQVDAPVLADPTTQAIMNQESNNTVSSIMEDANVGQTPNNIGGSGQEQLGQTPLGPGAAGAQPAGLGQRNAGRLGNVGPGVQPNTTGGPASAGPLPTAQLSAQS
jgi:hypothetical protein